MVVEIGQPRARLVLTPEDEGDAAGIGRVALIRYEAGPLEGEFVAEVFGGSDERWPVTSFVEQLERLHADMNGTAHLHALENEISLSLRWADRGHIRGDVELRFHAPVALEYVRVNFPFDIDQSYLPELISGLKSNFPGL
jgi:hypothetical protein